MEKSFEVRVRHFIGAVDLQQEYSANAYYYVPFDLCTCSISQRKAELFSTEKECAHMLFTFNQVGMFRVSCRLSVIPRAPD